MCNRRSPERKPVRVRRYARLKPVAPRYTWVIIPSFEAVLVAARASKDARLVPELRGKPRGGMLKATWQFSFVTNVIGNGKPAFQLHSL